ncbi:MAG: J domain-containing protein [Nannocystaceae bacterium]|nr:J domain-containing protein [bacterium]
MDRLTAFELLGLSPGADAKAIKRAYHKRLKTTKPDRDPEGFKRLRAAFEVATSDAPALEEPAAEWSSPRLTTQRTLNAVAVHHALDEGRFAEAHATVMDTRWADALLDDPGGAYAEATRRTGIATILDHRPAYEAVAAVYPDVFRPNDPELQLLLGISREWQRLLQASSVPPEVRAFVAKCVIVDEASRLSLARGLVRWYWRDRPSAMAAVVGLLEDYPAVASFLYQQVRAFDEYVPSTGPIPLQRQPTPSARIRFATLWTPLIVVAAALVISAISSGPIVDRIVGALVLAVGLLFLLGHPANSSQVHAGYLASCLAHDEPPEVAARRVRLCRRLRRALGENIALDFGFRVGRLARLGPASAPVEDAAR